MAKAPIDIRSLARTHSKAAITTLASIMYEPKCKASDRINAAEALLNRGYGKATQPVGLADDARMQISEIKLVIIDTARTQQQSNIQTIEHSSQSALETGVVEPTSNIRVIEHSDTAVESGLIEAKRED